jgi:hypothetical protein
MTIVWVTPPVGASPGTVYGIGGNSLPQLGGAYAVVNDAETLQALLRQGWTVISTVSGKSLSQILQGN